MVGSPPPTRGKLRIAKLVYLAAGLTPAHAGKTAAASGTPDSTRAHPRPRGENGYYLLSRSSFSGSPPPTRGKLPPLQARPILPGLTPAHAGKTLARQHAHFAIGAHPRPRGENIVKAMQPVIKAAHPRPRGENLIQTPATSRKLGSPPPTRGKPTPWRSAMCAIRLTPAHAGKTVVQFDVGKVRRAHPRPRGENWNKAQEISQVLGSPPPTRGKLCRHAAACFGRRLTPAHAGKT